MIFMPNTREFPVHHNKRLLEIAIDFLQVRTYQLSFEKGRVVTLPFSIKRVDITFSII
jgi:hypothetical protein